ncbi:MAG: hypothetical protein CL810_06110 [Cobetia sp.]|jgi:hypothetical protein|uniref:Sbal_3080 family lipoprotein n=1 Tax=Cobetia sp. TaxID=1873876 RepID=UPI000C661C65|nr:Sbal_3080 family lipoprotein [Cobetia sp.]MBF09417.1 hypothetical protein [Cobetia sp.]MBK09125.1 hypothetical protein [Cobetia sp.]HBJ28500.1 hypothetical protein [Cobetia sp.]|tara:strand:+ start:171 stop:608 length:438 start_codon:yes stop_codon:yes gene_type:complete
MTGMTKALLAASITLVMAGCTSVQVQPLERMSYLDTVCIERNEAVIVPGFLNVIQQGFSRNGLNTRVYDAPVPGYCEVVLKYTALRSWDYVTYLSHAELWLDDPYGDEIAYAQYHLIAKGGLGFSKYASVETKMNPVIDDLLVNY